MRAELSELGMSESPVIAVHKRCIMSRRVVITVLAIGLLAACSSADTPKPGLQYISTPYRDPCVKPSLLAPEAVKVGEAFSATLRLTNACNELATVPVESSNPANLVVITESETVVWTLYELSGVVPLLPPTLETLQPGEALEFDVSWAGSNADEYIPVGTYTLIGLLTIVDEGSTKPFKDFEVRRPLTVTP
jgi:hypothetical protein